jgi:hypothetical protein
MSGGLPSARSAGFGGISPSLFDLWHILPLKTLPEYYHEYTSWQLNKKDWMACTGLDRRETASSVGERRS